MQATSKACCSPQRLELLLHRIITTHRCAEHGQGGAIRLRPMLPWCPQPFSTLPLQAAYQYDPYYSNLVYSQPVVRLVLYHHVFTER